jgi:DNA (cytosine-5)-methyltransferase 1
MNELALFAGAGGGLLGGHLLGWRTVCAVEWDAYAASVLVARQNDGVLPSFPIWDDVQTFDGQPWRGIVDVVSGGFPCQDISSAGKGAGIDGERSGMWRHMARIIGEVRPKFVFVENSPLLVSRGLTRVLGDLTEMGYDAKWGVLGAHHVGAPHKRQRVWIVAYPATSGLQGDKSRFSLSTTRRAVQPLEHGAEGVFDDIPKPYGLRSYHGVANAVDRIKAIGNGQVPAVARLAWNVLTKNI